MNLLLHKILALKFKAVVKGWIRQHQTAFRLQRLWYTQYPVVGFKISLVLIQTRVRISHSSGKTSHYVGDRQDTSWSFIWFVFCKQNMIDIWNLDRLRVSDNQINQQTISPHFTDRQVVHKRWKSAVGCLHPYILSLLATPYICKTASLKELNNRLLETLHLSYTVNQETD